jgi:hypothetical protein
MSASAPKGRKHAAPATPLVQPVQPTPASPPAGGSPRATASPMVMPQPQPGQPKAGKTVSGPAFKAAFEIAKILANLSKKDQTSAMQMAGVQAGLSVTSQFARIPTVSAAVPLSGPQGRPAPRVPPPQAKWGHDVKAKQSEIAGLNRQIAAVSAANGGQQLPTEHPLLLQRGQAFRDLQGLKGAVSAPQ